MGGYTPPRCSLDASGEARNTNSGNMIVMTNIMTNVEFREQVGRWKLLINQVGITLPNGDEVPDKFFHVFLGVGYSTFKKMVSGQDSARKIQLYTFKTIRFLNKLESNVFLDEVRLAIPEYTALYKG
jgi:hypothetical protein